MSALISAFRRRVAVVPCIQVLVYGLALSLTYRQGIDPLLESRDLLRKAIQHEGQIEFFHQTLGYVYEVLETAHGRKGQLELALEHYRKALFLNDSRQNPRNRANLLLNLGNASYLLGDFDQAFAFYRLRAESGADFQNKDTELVFYRRYGQAAFLTEKGKEPVQAFAKGLDLIEQRLDPKQASHILGKLHRSIKERILLPARKQGLEEGLVQTLFQRQSAIHSRLFRASRKAFGPPPDPGWTEYEGSVRPLLAEQKGLILDLEPLARRMSGLDWAGIRKSLLARLDLARQALDFPLELREMEAEMLDRLGLAFQEADAWSKARQRFEQAFALNRELGNFQNLAPNRRSAGYNAYLQAGEATGRKRTELLQLALSDFREVLELIERHGVPEPKKTRRKTGLISISIDLALEEQAATQAQYGFSQDQEKRLAQAFISRIQTELGRLEPARKAAAEQLQAYPEDKALPDRDLFGVSLLLHRSAHLESAGGDPARACERFLRSARLALKMSSPVSSALNVGNAALSLSRAVLEEDRKRALSAELVRLDKEAERLLAGNAEVLDALIPAGYHNRMGVAYAALATGRSRENVSGAAASLLDLTRAVSHFSRGLAGLKDAGARDRSALALEAALHLNLADLAGGKGARNTARTHFEKALIAAERGRLARFQWRSLAGLGRVEEAVRVLAGVPLFERGCGPFEVLGRLRALVEGLEKKNAPARAFNTLEELSELERVQRMTPRALRAASPESLQEMRSLKERLLRLEGLSDRLAAAAGEDKAYLEGRLEEERRLLEAALDREDAFSASFLERFQSLERRNSFLLLAGLSAEMILAAKREVRQGEKERREDLQQAYLQARDAFVRRMQEARALLGPEEPAGLLGLFVPAPVQAADVAASLPREATAVRLLPGRTQEGGWLAFILDASGLERLRFEARKPPLPEGQGLRILLFEAPLAVDFAFEGLHALSGTHLVRSVDAKKPFKRKVLIYPEGPGLAEAFEAMALHQPVEPLDIAGMSPQAHTVLFDAPVGARRTVPTRKGRLPEEYLGMELQDGRHMDLTLLSGRLDNVSLVLLNQGLKDDLYALGHLFSLFGASTVLLPSEDPGSAQEIQAFFRRYAGTSLLKARQGTLASGSAPGASWLQLGHWGLQPEAAAELARQRFASFVREGVEAYRSGKYSNALGLFENGLLVVYEIKQFGQYEAKLLEYARESAFAAGDLKRAAHHAAELARYWAEQRPGSQAQAQALLKQGLVLARLERFDEAVPRLQQAVEILEHLDLPLEQIQALSDLGTVLENATEYDRALQGFEAAASLSREVGGRELQARQAMHIGRIYDLRLSRYAMAKASYRRALEIYEDLGQERAAAQAQLDLARCNRLLGRFGATKELLAGSLQRVRNLPETKRLQTKIVLEQANLAWFQARYQEAFTLQQKALKEARHNDWLLEQVIGLNTAGLTWWTLGKSERALRDLRRALEMARSLDIRRDEVATTYNNMGLVLREQKRFDQALEILHKALAIDREIGSRWAMAYDLRNIGLTHLHRGHPQQALPLLEKALSLSAEIGNAVNQAKSLLALGEALLQLDRLDAAQARFEEALTLSRDMALRETVWRALYGLGRIHELRDELKKARQQLLEAVKIVETLRTEIKISQLRDSFLAGKMEAYEALVSVLLRMGREREAFSAAERSRSRNLIDLLGNQSLRLSGEREQELYERFASLQAAIEEQEKLAAQAEAEQDRQVYRETLQDLQDKARDLLLQIQAEHPELVSLVAVDTLSVQGVMERLDPGVTLLTYYLLPDGIVCWVLSAESFKTIQVPVDRERLKGLVLEFRRTLQNLEPYQAEARRLSELLVEPMRRELELAENVGLVPHRSLHYLSFAALFFGDRPLLEARPLFTLPSASLLRYTLKRRVQGKSRQVLAVGNPALEDLQLELPFAEHEVKAIGWNFPAPTTLIGEEATESRLVENAPGFDVVHIASHGSYDPAQPMLSSLKLADDPQQDGDLKATEVFGLSLRADLVVLSACQSGLGQIRQGDEVIGLNRAFMYAGAHAIISSLWRVSDISTAILMKQFYREYVRRNKASSLRRAMLHTRRYYPHPGYWAGFLLLGDYL